MATYITFHDFANGYGINITHKQEPNWGYYHGTDLSVNGESVIETGTNLLYPRFSSAKDGYAAQQFLTTQISSILGKLQAQGFKAEISAHMSWGSKMSGFILEVTDADGNNADSKKVHELIGKNPIKITPYKVAEEKQKSQLAGSLAKGIGLASGGSGPAAAGTTNPNSNPHAPAKK